jgi:hypothetical protein
MRCVLAGLIVICTTPAIPALMIALKSPAQRALSAETVVVGKVTAIEKEAVEAAPFPGAANKVQYRIAVVKIETAFAGAKNVTHIKVGFVPPPPPMNPLPGGPRAIRPPIRRGPMLPELKEGKEYVFFLSKHRDANFFVMSNMSPPLDAKAEETKKDLEAIKKVLAVVADPMKSLKAEKADDRAFAAAVLAGRYRAYPDQGGEVEQTPIPADESKLILKGLAEADWTRFDRTAPNGMQAFYSLGVTHQDGWTPPKAIPAKPGQPAPNYNLLAKEAFLKWLEGPGKEYRIKKLVPKSK